VLFRKKTSHQTQPYPKLPDPAYVPQPISELVAVAAMLMSVPGLLIYLTVVIGIQVLEISLAENLIAPMMLACIGLGLFGLAVIGLLAGLWNSIRSGVLSRHILLSLWVQGGVLVSLILLALLTPQLQ